MKHLIKLKLLTALILFLCCELSTKAQQDPQYTQFMYNKLPQNAAYTGSREGISFRIVYRDQWSKKKNNKLEGAPKTASFCMHSPLKKEAFALGFYFVND